MLTEGPAHTSAGDWTPDHLGRVIADRGWCGRSFEAGLLRFHDARSGALAGQQVEQAFGVPPTEVGWFAVDWLGRQYGSVTPEGEGPELRQVVLADVATNTLTRVRPLAEFLAQVEDGGIVAELNQQVFQAALGALGADQLAFDECVSYIHPPFLGGGSRIDNFEISDIDVYWTVVGQVLAQVRDQPAGTRVTDIRVDGGSA